MHVDFTAEYPPTSFIALNKCKPGRKFVEFINLENHTVGDVRLDREWINLLRT